MKPRNAYLENMRGSTMFKLIVSYQNGPWSDGCSVRSLNLAIKLMQRILPHAEIHVTTQAPLQELPSVIYHQQESLYSHGRFCQPLDINLHRLHCENDHILWMLPPAVNRWLARNDATLAWLVDWDYYGNYAERVGGFRACPGMYGLPPGLVMPMPPLEERGDDQSEQGFVASWLREHPPHEIVTHDEVSCYMPNHDILKHTHSKVGTCGVHLAGLNRGWSAGGEKLLGELEKMYL